VNAFTVFSVSRPRIRGESAGILNLVGSNWHVPCVNKTKGAPFMLSMRHMTYQPFYARAYCFFV
jgi:hypothetical protein